MSDCDRSSPPSAPSTSKFASNKIAQGDVDTESIIKQEENLSVETNTILDSNSIVNLDSRKSDENDFQESDSESEEGDESITDSTSGTSPSLISSSFHDSSYTFSTDTRSGLTIRSASCVILDPTESRSNNLNGLTNNLGQQLRYDVSSQQSSMLDPKLSEAIRNQLCNDPFVGIKIPTAFLTSKKNSTYHVYQIFIQTKKNKEWNVYRRYSQFHALHQSLKLKCNIIKKYDFPPKKRLGSRTANTVQQRCKKLELYLQTLVDYLQSDPLDCVKLELFDIFNRFLLVGNRFEIDSLSPIPNQETQ